MSISDSESRSIHLLRVLSVMSIIVCHIFQYYKNDLCQIFNIGVQVFWAISGYLYGEKTIDSWGDFYLKRIRKIHFPFIIWVLGVFVVFYFNGINITINHLITYMFSLQGESHYFARFGLKGLGHLWFLTGLWVCYFSLPLLQNLRRKNFQLIVVALSVTIFIYGTVLFFSSYYLWIFAFAYLYGWLNESRMKKVMRGIVFILALLFIITTTWDNLHNQYYWRLHHIFIGMACLMIFVRLSILIKKEKWGGHILIKVSTFSYYIYLTHMVWIFGPLSLLDNKGSILFNIMMVLLATFISSLLLNNLSNMVNMALCQNK